MKNNEIDRLFNLIDLLFEDKMQFIIKDYRIKEKQAIENYASRGLLGGVVIGQLQKVRIERIELLLNERIKSIDNAIDKLGLQISDSLLKEIFDKNILIINSYISEAKSKFNKYCGQFEFGVKEQRNSFICRFENELNIFIQKNQREYEIRKLLINSQKQEHNKMNNYNSNNNIWHEIEKEYAISKREFGKRINFVKGDFKREIIFRDIEQAFKLLKMGFGKPVAILSGGVIEELLRLYLNYKGKNTKDRDFYDYIEICKENDFLKDSMAKLSHVVRDYRNYVHLSKEISKKYTISMAAANTLFTSIFMVVNDFEKANKLFTEKYKTVSWIPKTKDNHIKSSFEIKFNDRGEVWSDVAIYSNFIIKYNVSIHKDLNVKNENGVILNPDIRLILSKGIAEYPRIVCIFPWELSEKYPDQYECHIDYFKSAETGDHKRIQQVPVGEKNIDKIKEFKVVVSFFKDLSFESSFFEDSVKKVMVPKKDFELKGYSVNTKQFIGFEVINCEATISNIVIQEIFT